MTKLREKILRPVHPNLGDEASFRRRLDKLIDDMTASVQFWIEAAYKRRPPATAIAMDETAAEALQREIRDLAERWIRQIDDAAPRLAEWFAQAANKRSTSALQRILREAGISIEFQLTPAMADILAATVAQSVSLIRSIPRQYFGEIEGMVMRSVQQGRDLGPLAKELRARYGVTKRRAALIARTQNNMATAAITRTRMVEAGITQAIWVHSSAGKEPRPTHVKAGRDRVVFDVARGWFDPHEKQWIQPGQLINCRCVARPVVKGFD